MPNVEPVDRAFSLLVRLSAADEEGKVTCVTCGVRLHYKEAHCGHFVPRGNQATRFERRNCGCQCENCNLFNGGMPATFARYIDRKYGPGAADEMRSLGRTVCKRTSYEIKEMADQFRQEVARIRKEKGL